MPAHRTHRSPPVMCRLNDSIDMAKAQGGVSARLGSDAFSWNSSSYNFSPGRSPVNTMSISSRGRSPARVIICSQDKQFPLAHPCPEQNFATVPICASLQDQLRCFRDRHEVALMSGGSRLRATVTDLLAESGHNAAAEPMLPNRTVTKRVSSACWLAF